MMIPGIGVDTTLPASPGIAPDITGLSSGQESNVLGAVQTPATWTGGIIMGGAMCVGTWLLVRGIKGLAGDEDREVGKAWLKIVAGAFMIVAPVVIAVVIYTGGAAATGTTGTATSSSTTTSAVDGTTTTQ